MLAQPLSADQLLLRGSVPTELSAVVNSSLFDLHINLPSMLRTSEVRQSRAGLLFLFAHHFLGSA
jgi:hypothetical protein